MGYILNNDNTISYSITFMGGPLDGHTVVSANPLHESLKVRAPVMIGSNVSFYEYELVGKIPDYQYVCLGRIQDSKEPN